MTNKMILFALGALLGAGIVCQVQGMKEGQKQCNSLKGVYLWLIYGSESVTGKVKVPQAGLGPAGSRHRVWVPGGNQVGQQQQNQQQQGNGNQNPSGK
jgi:hypothetical protein